MIDWTDLERYVALPRVTDIALNADGTRLVASVQQPDEKGAGYTSALWEIDLDGGPARRLTWSEKGESCPAFRPDGSLLFVSGRPDPDGEEDEPSLWQLPPGGEATVLARSPGGVGAPVVARATGTVVVGGSRLVGSADAEDDAARRRERKDRKITAILHTGMPIRQWDQEIGYESPRLLVVGDAGELRDLTPDAAFALVEAQYSISADGRRLATSWRRRERGGGVHNEVAVLDTETGARELVIAEPAADHEAPAMSPDGRWVAALREWTGTFDDPLTREVLLHPVAGGTAIRVDLGDLSPSELAWAPDSATLFVAGDWHGRGPVVAVDPTTGKVRHTLADDAAYSNLRPSPDGRGLFALRSAVDAPPTPVRLVVDEAGQKPEVLVAPTPELELPGSVVEVAVDTDGDSHRAFLCLPPGADSAPAPLMLWIHGGPFLSANGWSWRWNPWLAVARGWAVLLPDAPLSTGYGPGWIARAWPHRAANVWRDLETLLDEVVTRPDIDGTRTACLGGSFGGYMTNWIAGHTDRFGAIVTHAGLWALDQQHTTTDAAYWKSGLFGTPADHPEWYAENSPHHFADRIRTPMLVIHGNRDYRVPISEALRLWWDLVSRFDGDPEDLPHRFLQLTGENHWVLSPANVQIWYETVLDFCQRHVRG